MMYLLGLGSSTHPLPPETWDAWKRTTFEYDGIRYIGSFAPLFIHQYSQAWFDFRDKRDKYADYFQNSVIATDVHRRFCIDLANAISRLQRRSVGHHRLGFGHTATSCGAGRRRRGRLTERWCRARRRVRCRSCRSRHARAADDRDTRYGAAAWSRYGFVDAFNPLTKWYDTRRDRHRHGNHAW